MIAKVCLIVLLGCVLAETNPLLARFKRRTAAENAALKAAAQKQADEEIQEASVHSGRVHEVVVANMKVAVIDALDEIGATVLKAGGDYGKSVIELGRQISRSGTKIIIALQYAGYVAASSALTMSNATASAAGAVLSEAVKDTSVIFSEVADALNTGVSSSGNFIVKSTNYTSNGIRLTLELTSEGLKKLGERAGSIIDRTFNAAYDTAGNIIIWLTPTKKPAATVVQKEEEPKKIEPPQVPDPNAIVPKTDPKSSGKGSGSGGNDGL